MMIDPLSPKDIVEFLKNNITPLPDNVYGPGYQAAIYLTDGTYLPCIIFRNAKPLVDLAMRRFNEEKKGQGIFKRNTGFGYEEIVKSFVAAGNCINYYDIAIVEKSPYAFSKEILNQIHGETTMAWTCFVVKMNDGKFFSFGSSFRFEFFELPDGYSINNIAEIINHSYIDNNGVIKNYRNSDNSSYDRSKTFRERPFFECFIDGL